MPLTEAMFIPLKIEREFENNLRRIMMIASLLF